MSAFMLRIPGTRPDAVQLTDPRARSAPCTAGERLAFRLQSHDGGFEHDALARRDGGGTELRPDRIQRSFLVNGIRPGPHPGRVLVLPGDRVSFTCGFRRMNGSPPRSALSLPPVHGSLTVPATRVSICPEAGHVELIAGRQRSKLPPEGLLIRKSALVGRPCKRWFWRTLDS